MAYYTLGLRRFFNANQRQHAYRASRALHDFIVTATKPKLFVSFSIASAAEVDSMGYAIPDDNPEGRAFISVILVFFVISLFSTAVRFYSRRLRKLSLDVSDYACFLGEVSVAWLDLRVTIRLIVHEFINIGLVALLWMGKLASYHQ